MELLGSISIVRELAKEAEAIFRSSKDSVKDVEGSGNLATGLLWLHVKLLERDLAKTKETAKP